MTRSIGALALLAFPALLPAFQEKGSIEGRVVNALSGDSVRRVSLTLTRINGKDDRAVMTTDSDGRFAFSDLEAGAYRLAGERAGYRRQAYGARMNPAVGTLLVVAAGQTLKDVVFKLAPDAVLSGQVLDQDGEPMPNLLVSVRKSGYAGGKRDWTNAGTMQTNDRGEYRIAGLGSGRYIVLATDMNLGIGLAGVSRGAMSDQPDTAYATTYYGNTLDLSRAAVIDLAMGDDRRGTNIQMIKTTTVRVRGKVVNPPESGQILLMLSRRGAGGGQSTGNLGMAQAPEGSFEITGVTPGSYILTARSVTDPLKAAGMMLVEVGDKHVDGLQFRLAPGAELRGHVIIPGGKTEGVIVSLDGGDSAMGEAPSAGAREDGRFTLTGVYPGKYSVRVRGLPEIAYVRSVKLGGQEVEGSALEISGAAELEIAVSGGGAVAEGVVAGADGKPASGATVVLVPDSKREADYATVTADQDGVFTIKGVRPGRYRALAWEDLESGAFRDPEFVKAFENRAVTVALEESGRAKVRVQAIPFDEVARNR
jgi:protocatechuate 3,4-dioxygenase beta subunit